MEISLEDIKEFSKEYNSNPTNKIIENAITTNGLEEACLNRDVIAENQFVFNIELPDSKRYHQKDSWKCWIYAGINMIKYNMAKNLNINLMNFELSSNYIAFFDKLEKSNYVYENIIQLSQNADLDFIKKEKIIDDCVDECGDWEYFKSVISKYGIVPNTYMLNPIEGEKAQKITRLYREKVKKDIAYLWKAKQQGKDDNSLRNMKKEYVKENYILLSKILGEPPYTFDYEYRDEDNKYIKIKDLTPRDFVARYLTLNLEDFVKIGNVPMYNKEYEKIYEEKYSGNIYENCSIKFLNLPIEELKDMAVQQLKDGIPVYISLHTLKSRYEKAGILDTRIYNYEQTLGITPLSKREGFDFSEINSNHAMVLTGVNIVDKKTQRWKVEDSYGTEGKPKGYYIMNDNFFEKFTRSIIIHKKYLTEEQRILLEQEPIKYISETNI